MVGVGADVGEEAPAAFALGIRADFDGGGEGFDHASWSVQKVYAAISTSARWIMDSKRALSCCF